MKNIQAKAGLVQMGLSRKEADIFLALLEKGPQTATEVARQVGKPRTSVLLLLEELKENGFVLRIKVGGHFEWEAVDLGTLESEYKERQKIVESALPLLRDLVKEQAFSKKFSVKVFSGASGLLKAYYRLLDLPRGERLYFIDGVDAVRSKMKMRDSSMKDWQEAFKSSGVIMEVLGSPRSLLEVKLRKGSDVMATHLDRKILLYALPDSVSDFPADIAILPNTIILFIPKQELAICIDSSELALSLRTLFEGLKLISTPVDVNREVNKLLV